MTNKVSETTKTCPSGHTRPASMIRCKTCASITAKRHYEKNKEHKHALARERYRNNPETRRAQAEAARRWRHKNKNRLREYRNARLKLEKLDHLTAEQAECVRLLYATAQALTESCGTPFHVDHIIPLSKGGEHAPWNLQILPGSANCAKHDRLSKASKDHVTEAKALWNQP